MDRVILELLFGGEGVAPLVQRIKYSTSVVLMAVARDHPRDVNASRVVQMSKMGHDAASHGLNELAQIGVLKRTRYGFFTLNLPQKAVEPIGGVDATPQRRAG